MPKTGREDFNFRADEVINVRTAARNHSVECCAHDWGARRSAAQGVS
jgi:hypothetical protein